MIKNSTITIFAVILLSVTILMANTYISETNNTEKSEKENTATTGEVEKAEETEPIASEEAFDKMMQVLTHKRCVNCHPNGDRPHQGEDSHVHNFGVMRGDKNHGVAALQCESSSLC